MPHTVAACVTCITVISLQADTNIKSPGAVTPVKLSKIITKMGKYNNPLRRQVITNLNIYLIYQTNFTGVKDSFGAVCKITAMNA